MCSEVVLRPLAGVMEGEAAREVTGWQEGALWGRSWVSWAFRGQQHEAVGAPGLPGYKLNKQGDNIQS